MSLALLLLAAACTGSAPVADAQRCSCGAVACGAWTAPPCAASCTAPEVARCKCLQCLANPPVTARLQNECGCESAPDAGAPAR